MKIVNNHEKEISVDEVVNNRNDKTIVVYLSRSSTRMNVFQWCILSKLDTNKYGFIRLGYPNQSNPTYVHNTFAQSVREAVKNREVHVFNTFEEFVEFTK